jgi:SNF2 family DNA or RNA helicase
VPTADVNANRIIVHTQWNERELIKLVPGARWDPVNKFWHMPLTWTSCVVLRGVFAEKLVVGGDLNDWAWLQRPRIERLMAMRNLTKLPGDAWVDRDDRLYDFQRVGSTFVQLASEALLADEMGTGKTIQVLNALDVSDQYPALVICPNSVKTNWADETARWTAEGVPYVVTGGAVGRKKVLEAAAQDPSAVVIVNIESVRLLSRLTGYGSIRLRRCRECDKTNGEQTLKPAQCEVHPKELNRIPFRTVIIDEAHRIKNPQSKQTRSVWAVAHQHSVRQRWALTGTPLANHPGDLWSILHAISPLDFPARGHFVDRYCLQSWNAFGGLDIVGINPAARAEFDQLLDSRFRRMPKALVLSQLPAKIRTTRWVDLTPAQAKVYRQLDDQVVVNVDGTNVSVTDQLVARIRHMQIASSMVKIDDTTWIPCEPSPKLDELELVLEEHGDAPIVVCAEQRKLIDLAAARLDKLRISYGLITGAITEYERKLTLEQFQAGKLRVLLFTLKAGGTGLTMTAADTIVFLQRSDSMIDNKQAEDRVHRIGSEIHESIHVIDIVARGTVEEKQIVSLTEKFLRLQEITRDRATIIAAGGRPDELDAEEARIMAVKL